MWKIHWASALALVCFLAASSAPAAGETSEVRFPNILMGLPDEEVLELKGQLVKPEGAGPFPAVVILHSCGGMNQQVTDRWPDFLAEAGYAVLTVDSFSTRVLGKCPNALSKTWKTRQHMVRDAYGGLNYLATLPFIDKDKVGLMGFSLGGHAVNLRAGGKARKRIKTKPKIEFRAGIAFYAKCKPLNNTKKFPFPLAQIVGSRDNKVKDCQKIAKGPATVHVIEGAAHSFDNIELTKAKVDGYGNPIEYDGAAETKSRELVKAFFEKNLRNASPRQASKSSSASGASSGGGFLNGSAIKDALIGNTILLDFPTKGPMFFYFESDSRFASAWAKKPSKIFKKKWWVKGENVMCRHAGKKKRKVCSKIKAGGDGTLKFFSTDGELLYETKVMAGNKIPQ